MFAARIKLGFNMLPAIHNGPGVHCCLHGVSRPKRKIYTLRAIHTLRKCNDNCNIAPSHTMTTSRNGTKVPKGYPSGIRKSEHHYDSRGRPKRHDSHSKLMAKALPTSSQCDYSGQQPTHFMDIPPIFDYGRNPQRFSLRNLQPVPTAVPGAVFQNKMLRQRYILSIFWLTSSSSRSSILPRSLRINDTNRVLF